MIDLFAQKVAILCAQRKSIYSQLSGIVENSQPIDVEIFDCKRDARSFAGGCPVVAHPPCRLWGRLKGMPKLSPEQKAEEMDLGRFCARMVIENGGVLEHPFDSALFADMGLPAGGRFNELGFTLEITQRMFGHSMMKPTWLFFAGIKYEEVEAIRPLLHNQPRKAIENLSTKQREATPRPMAEWLVRHAARAKQPVNPGSKNSQLSCASSFGG